MVERDFDRELRTIDRRLIRHIVTSTLVFFLNVGAVVYYEYQERTTFHIILQSIHLAGAIIMIWGFYRLYKMNREVKRLVKMRQEHKKVLEKIESEFKVNK
jgi:hypothetical protein